MNELIPYVTAAAGSVSGLIAVVTPFWRKIRSISHLIDDWQGEPARPGVPERKGVMVRLQEIEDRVMSTEYHVRPNHGGSSHDNMMKQLKKIEELISDGKQA